MEKNTQPQRAIVLHPRASEPNGAGHCAAAAQRDGPQRQLYGQAAGRNGKARAGRRRFVRWDRQKTAGGATRTARGFSE